MNNNYKSLKIILSYLLILCLLLADLSAIAESLYTLTIPGAMTIIKKESFYNATSLERVELPEGITEIQTRAFARSSLTEINFPSSITYIADDAFDESSLVTVHAEKGTYAYDWAVEHGYIKLDNEYQVIYSCSGKANIGSMVLWFAEEPEGDNNLLYRFELEKNGEAYEQADYSRTNYYEQMITEYGSYKMKVSYKDEKGKKIEAESTELVVSEPAVQIVSVTSDGTIFVEGEAVTWTVETTGGKAPIEYRYELKKGEITVLTQDYTQSNTYSCAVTEAGEYKLWVMCREANANIVNTCSEGITVCTIEEAYPEAPELIFDDGMEPFSKDEGEAPIYEAQSISIKWEANENVTNYTVSLYQKEDTEWKPVIEEEAVSGERYTLNSSLFTELMEDTEYKFVINANGIYSGEPEEYYFTIDVDEAGFAITINGKNELIWNQAWNKENTREFEISSQKPWMVTECSADWVECNAIDDSRLMVKISHNDALKNRSVTIMLNNGFENATLKITQGDCDTVPELESPSFSRDENNPTLHPWPEYGMIFEASTNGIEYDVMRIYEKQASGDYVLVYTEHDSYVEVMSDIYAFKQNTIYCIELLNCLDKNYQENEVMEDILSSKWYMQTMTDGNSMSVDESNIEIMYTASIELQCTSDFVAYEISADWLHEKNVENNGSVETDNVSLSADPNFTGNSRETDVIYHCGSASVTVHVTQPSMLPHITYPVNLSQNQKSPTLIGTSTYCTDFYYEGIFDTSNFYIVGNDTAEDFGSRASKIMTWDCMVPASYFVPSKVYRLEVKSGDYVTNYYVKTGSRISTKTIALDGSTDEQKWTVAASGESRSLKVKGSSSWTASSDSSWLTLSSSSGTTTAKTITVTAAKNTTGKTRCGYISFYCGSEFHNVLVVTQNGQDYLEFDKEDITDNKLENIDGKGKTYSIGYRASQTVNASSNVNWITNKNGRLSLTVANNSTGSVRTGLITVTCGNITKIITVTQQPMLDAPVIVSPTLWTSYSDCGFIEYEDIPVKWNAVNGAVSYEIYTKYRLDGTVHTNTYTIPSDGSKEYSFIIPKECYSPLVTDQQSIDIIAYNAYGHKRDTYYYFYMNSGDKAIVNGTDTPKWKNASDLSCSSDFSIHSTNTWYASTESNWINLSRTSGADGDVLTLTLSENTNSTPRSGSVEVRVNNNVTAIEVSQCAMLPQFPIILSPAFSEDEACPTVITSCPDSLTVTWPDEPQAEVQLHICEYSERSAGHIVAKSPYIKTGNEYTFTELNLETGHLYWIEIVRFCDRWGGTGNRYYFTIEEGDSYIQIDGETEQSFDAFGTDDYVSYIISASGNWSASTDEDWIMVWKKYLDQDDLDEKGATTARYSVYTGAPGGVLCVSVLENTTGRSRTGTVTLRCGSVTARILIFQYQNYSTALLTSPNLATNRNEAEKLPYGSVSLFWSSGNGGTGNYRIKLQESSKQSSGYKTIYDEDDIIGNHYTIPATKLTEGMYYCIMLGTEIEPGDYEYESYYFRVSYQDELQATMALDSEQVDVTGAIVIHVNAQGGAGGYKYAYQLWQGSTMLYQTDYSFGPYYTMGVPAEGNYYVRAYVKDSSGEQIYVDSNKITASDVEDYVYIDNAANATGEIASSGGSLRVLVRSKVNWKWNCDQSWVSVNASGTKDSYMQLTADANTTGAIRTATITVTAGTATAKITVRQGVTSNLECIPSSLSVEAAKNYQTISVYSSGTWSAAASSAWIKLSKTYGSSGESIRVELEQNTGSSRSGYIDFTCSGKNVRVPVSQASANQTGASGITKVTGQMNVQTGEPISLTVYAEGYTRVRMIVDGVVLSTEYVINDFNVAYVNYAFSQSGRRNIQFSALRNGVWTEPSKNYIMTVTSPNGDLDSVRFGAINEQYSKGDTVTITWSDNGNATNYVAYIYKDGSLLAKKTMGESGMTANSLTLTSSMLDKAGHYDVAVMSTGVGYNQSYANRSFDIQYDAYLQCKTADLYTDENRGKVVETAKYGVLYTVKSEKAANGKVMACIYDGSGLLGYCEAEKLGSEYWHPCLKNGVYVHTFSRESYEAVHPHRLFKICSECDKTEYVMNSNGEYITKVPASTLQDSCCTCGNHVLRGSYSKEHPHYMIKSCANCDFAYTDTRYPQSQSTCCVCMGHDFGNDNICFRCGYENDDDRTKVYNATYIKSSLNATTMPPSLVILYNEVYSRMGFADNYEVLGEHPFICTLAGGGIYLPGAEKKIQESRDKLYQKAALASLYSLCDANKTEYDRKLATLRNLKKYVDLAQIGMAIFESAKLGKNKDTLAKLVGPTAYNKSPDWVKKLLDSQMVSCSANDLQELVTFEATNTNVDEIFDSGITLADKILDQAIANMYREAVLNSLSRDIENLLLSSANDPYYSTMYRNVINEMRASASADYCSTVFSVIVDKHTSTIVKTIVGAATGEDAGQIIWDKIGDFIIDTWLPLKATKLGFTIAMESADFVLHTSDNAEMMRVYAMDCVAMDAAYRELKQTITATPDYATKDQLASLYRAFDLFYQLTIRTISTAYDVIYTNNSTWLLQIRNGGAEGVESWSVTLTNANKSIVNRYTVILERYLDVCPAAMIEGGM